MVGCWVVDEVRKERLKVSRHIGLNDQVLVSNWEVR